MAKERLRFAEAAERESEASLDRAKRTLERAERTRERIEGELEEATIAERGARKELVSSESAHAKARREPAKDVPFDPPDLAPAYPDAAYTQCIAGCAG